MKYIESKPNCGHNCLGLERRLKNEKMDAKDWTTHHENSMFTSFSQDIKHSSSILLTRLSTVLSSN